MESLMTYMAAFGIAAGAGAKAFIPVLALGAFSYTPYFELSSRFEWIADPMVMAVLGVLIGGLVIAMYLPIFKLGQAI